MTSPESCLMNIQDVAMMSIINFNDNNVLT
jgi:hypothetical protein